MAQVAMAEHDLGLMLITLAVDEGSGSHPYTHSFELNASPIASRNLADALHLFSMLHGGFPGLIERAGERNVVPEADDWFMSAAAGFAAERTYLAQLTAAAGPTPSTPGDAATSAAVLGQRHALDVIAGSDRFGCALGATAALVLDWQPIRAVLDTAAERMQVPVPACTLPDELALSTLLAQLPGSERLDRTLAFGARQLLVQHRGLWDLLETRAGAREGW